MSTDLTLTIAKFLEKEFPNLAGINKKFGIYTHNIKISLETNLKELLEEWNYNDGFCYLKIVPG